jgi:enoyl-CoA hydratase/carnithine racemase
VAETLVDLRREGDIAVVTLNRPAKLNALTPAMLDDLEALARLLDNDNQVRVVVLTAAGERAFCVGADIGEWAALEPLDMWRRWVKRGHQVFDQWARLRQPVIAAINGHALGGGLELAITADIRIAAEPAQFALPEASIATCPGWSGTQRLVQLIGASRAKYLALSGMRYSARDALAAGLVHEVVVHSQLQTRALKLATQMAVGAPVALQLTKQLLNAASGEGAAATLEAMAGALAAHTEDAREGVRSFKDKRPPVYRGA